MNILQLNTGLFPDAQTVMSALQESACTDRVTTIDLSRRDLKESDWDAAIQAILAADRIITV